MYITDELYHILYLLLLHFKVLNNNCIYNVLTISLMYTHLDDDDSLNHSLNLMLRYGFLSALN